MTTILSCFNRMGVSMDMQINIRDGHCEVFFSGTFTFADNATFKDVLAAVDNPQVRGFVLDFSKVDFIDSSVLGMLMILRNEGAKHGQSVTIRGASGQVEKVMRVAKFDEKFAMVA